MQCFRRLGPVSFSPTFHWGAAQKVREQHNTKQNKTRQNNNKKQQQLRHPSMRIGCEGTFSVIPAGSDDYVLLIAIKAPSPPPNPSQPLLENTPGAQPHKISSDPGAKWETLDEFFPLEELASPQVEANATAPRQPLPFDTFLEPLTTTDLPHAQAPLSHCPATFFPSVDMAALQRDLRLRHQSIFFHTPQRRACKRISHTSESRGCLSCGTRTTPEWRKGPIGPKTLCNACGLRFAKDPKSKVETKRSG